MSSLTKVLDATESGSISDKEVTKQSGVLSPFGSQAQYATVLERKSQLSRNDMIETKRIASAQVHVERAMEQIKNYHFFDKALPSISPLSDLASQTFCVCYVM